MDIRYGQNEIKQILRSIGLALNVVHNCVVTDDVEAAANEKSWRIDHTKELDHLNTLEAWLVTNTDTDHE